MVISEFAATINRLLPMTQRWFYILVCCALPATGGAQSLDRYAEVVKQPTYRPLHHTETAGHIGEYGAVSGRVHKVTVKRTHAYVNFGADWKNDFTIYIPKDTLAVMGAGEITALQGRSVRVYGYIHSYYGPRITLLEPDKLEVIDATDE